jgi:hypothetical protein
MTIERELLKKILNTGWLNHELSCEVEAILAQPEQEQEPVEDRIARWHRLGYEQGKKASKREPLSDELEPVAWITEWVQRYRHNDTPIIDRAVSFTKGDAPAAPNPNYIPLYLAPPKGKPPMTQREMYQRGYAQAERDLKREPLTDENVCEILLKKEWKGFVQLVRIIEKAHGIGGEE